MRRVRLRGLKEGSEGGSAREGFAKRGYDHCCEVGPPKEDGKRGITEGGCRCRS